MATQTSPFLNFTDPVKPYPEDALEDVFQDMKSELKNPVDVDSFKRAARETGTHLPKIVAPRYKGGVVIESGKTPEFFSGNAGDAPGAKILLRPIAVHGRGAPRTLAAHINEPDGVSEKIVDAFVRVFGKDALDACRQGFREASLRQVMELKGENFPIVYVPGDEDGIQITPVPPAAAYVNMQDVFLRRKELKKETGDPRVMGDWMRPEIAAKKQIACPHLRDNMKAVLRARFPETLSEEDAALHRFVKGGPFPSIQDPDVVGRLVVFAERVHAHGRQGNYPMTKEIERSLVSRAKYLVIAVDSFVERVVSEASEIAGGNLLDMKRPGRRELLARSIPRKHKSKHKIPEALGSTFFEQAEKEVDR